MTIEAQVREHIEGETDKPVYMNRAPSGVDPPYIVQRLITKNNHGMGATQARIQFDIFGKDPNGYGQAKGISVSLNDTIFDLSESIDDIAGSYRVSEMETFDDSVNYYRIIVDAMVYYDERETFG